MGLYDEIMQYKINNYSMDKMARETEETSFNEILCLNKPKNKKDAKKHDDFEQEVNEFLELKFRLKSDPTIYKDDDCGETQFTLRDIKIYEIKDLVLKEKWAVKIDNREVKFLFSSKKQRKVEKFNLTLITEDKEIVFDADQDIKIETRDGITFGAFYSDQQENSIKLHLMIFDNFVSLGKLSTTFKDENDSPILKFERKLNSDNSISISSFNNWKILQTISENSFYIGRDSHKNSLSEKQYYVNISTKTKQIDGKFQFSQDSTFFDYLKENIENYQKSEDKNIPIKVKINFDLELKRNQIKCLYVESKSSSNYLESTLNQFAKHCKYLTCCDKDKEENLFLLFIQNHPVDLTLSKFDTIFSLDYLVAVILIDYGKFNSLPVVKEDPITKQNMLSKKYFLDLQEEFSKLYGADKSICNQSYNKFVLGGKKERDNLGIYSIRDEIMPGNINDIKSCTGNENRILNNHFYSSKKQGQLKIKSSQSLNNCDRNEINTNKFDQIFRNTHLFSNGKTDQDELENIVLQEEKNSERVDDKHLMEKLNWYKWDKQIMEQEITELRKDYVKLLERLDNKDNYIEDLKKKIDNLTQNDILNIKQLNASINENAILKERLYNKDNHIEDLKKKIDNLTQNDILNNKQLNASINENAILQERLDNKDKHIEDLVAEKKALEKKIDNLTQNDILNIDKLNASINQNAILKENLKVKELENKFLQGQLNIYKSGANIVLILVVIYLIISAYLFLKPRI